MGTAKAWMQNVHALKSNLERQQDLSKAMRENARMEDAQHSESFRDRYKHLMDRLKTDVRYFFSQLHDFVDLPQEFASHVYDLEMDMRRIDKNANEAMIAGGALILEPVVSMLNFRDAIVSLLVNGMLFQKAVLDWDLKSRRNYADAPMVEMFESVVNSYSKTGMVPAKITTDIPGVFDAGPFTFDKNQGEERVAATSPFQTRLLALLREMQSLDHGLRNLKFGQVNVPERHQAQGKNVAASELRSEVTKWFRKCETLESELQQIKANKHTPGEAQVVQLNSANKDLTNQCKDHITKKHKLEGEVQSLKNELASCRREKGELAERNAKMMKENLPVLERLDKLLGKSREAVDVLTADAELLSSMFRQQVSDNQDNIQSKEDMHKEVLRLNKQLKSERMKNQFKEDELRKKETLCLRTMAARKSIHESYLEQKQRITNVEEQMTKREADWQEMIKVMQGRDNEISTQGAELMRANKRISELELQKKQCMHEAEKITGRTYNALLEKFM